MRKRSEKKLRRGNCMHRSTQRPPVLSLRKIDMGVVVQDGAS